MPYLSIPYFLPQAVRLSSISAAKREAQKFGLCFFIVPSKIYGTQSRYFFAKVPLIP